ncbi:L-threonylcarbamoyladenylate synthase [soil metagenome]
MSGDVESAAAAIANGLVVGVPTDTVYGLAVDPWNEDSVEALFTMKGRPRDKPVGLLAANLGEVMEIAHLGPALSLAERHWPGALSVVVRPRVVIPDWVGDRALGTVAVRVPDHDVLRELLARTGPLAVTSANRSGEPEAADDVEARQVFGSSVAVYVPGRGRGGVASTVVDATGGILTTIRPGPVSPS